MQVKATKKLASWLNENLKKDAKFKNYEAQLVKMTEGQYRWSVGDVWDAWDYGDYSYTDGKCSAIVIIYPLDFYACDRYITTRELLELFNKSDKTADGFLQKIKDAIEA